ncbi:MAG: HEAT repeat domain-containing protein [Halanaerobiales bacterium]|nr:HEAT repeat domain-containing protein [Halanaerobiales bacterium]
MESEDVFLEIAQRDIIRFLGECRDVDSVDLIIEFYKKERRDVYKKGIIIALSRIASYDATKFLIEELSKAQKEFDKSFIYVRLFEMYFIADTKTKKIIYNTYNRSIEIKSIIPGKYVILYFEGNSEVYEILDKIVDSENQEMKEYLAETLQYGRIRDVDIIKNDPKLLKLTKKLYESGNEDIRVWINNYVE